MTNNEQTVRITLRIPSSLHEQLTEVAARDNRSMNAEIIQRLELSLDPRQLRLPSEWVSASGDGKVTIKSPRDLLDELQELTSRSQMLITMFQAVQEDVEVDLSDPPPSIPIDPSL